MHKGDVSKWTNIQGCENLLFFSQLVKELLFDYSIPSNRISTLNSHYLVRDALSAIHSIETKGVPEGTLKPIVEELYSELEKDAVFGDREPLNYFIKMQGDNSFHPARPKELNCNEQIKCVKAINTVFFADNNYYNLLKNAIINNIKSNNPKEQQTLFRLTKSLLTELKNSGYSLKYIYMIMNSLFWKPKFDIYSTNIIESFFDAFEQEKKEYTIIFKVKWFKMRPLITHFDGLDLLDTLPDDVIQMVDKAFLETRPDEKYLMKRCKALDPYSAADRELSIIENDSSFFRLYNHNYRYDLKTADYRVIDDRKYYKKGKNLNPVEHTKMPKEEHIIEGLNLAADMLEGLARKKKYTDSISILNAVKFHAHSLDSRAEENQLLDLWSIFESVLDISNKHTSDRIIQICEYLIPILKHQYLYSLFSHLAEDIRSNDDEWYENYIGSENDTSKVSKIAEFVLLEENKEDRKEFCERCGDFPLLRQRIEYYNDVLRSKKCVYAYVEKHAIRVKWQIMRIYRNRNLIIHNADKMPYLTLLIENLHSYVDDFLKYVIHEASNGKDISSMCQELFVKECKWNVAFRNRKEPLTKDDVQLMLSM